jgi:2-polyprenyl-3-methyl-5-hydroxy-6-metoxy-1,4-benzoquinol methylase
MTAGLVATGAQVTCVEGSPTFARSLRENFPTAWTVNSLFEDFEPEGEYDNIILGHVLEHVEDPVEILTRAGQWLSTGGIVFGAVPNAHSLHRQAAVIMGLLDAETDLNDMDRHHGHRRVFNPEEFRRVFTHAGFNIKCFGGYWLKPVSSKQIEDSWTDAMLQAFMQLGERYPDISGEIYVVASKL